MTAALLIARRDLIDALRDVRFFILACLVMGGVIAYCAVTMSAAGMAGFGASGYFSIYAWLVFFLAIIPIPPLAAVSITRERQADTLNQLLSAPLRPRDIILGKVLGVTGVYGVLLVVTLPLAGVVFFFTGVDWVQFVQVVAVSAGTALTCGALGVACSVRYPRRNQAVIASIFWMLFVMGIPQQVAGAMLFMLIIPIFVVLLYTFISPAMAISGILSAATPFALVGAAINLLVITALALRYARRRLAREEYHIAHAEAFERYLMHPRQLNTAARGSLRNPMLAKAKRLAGQPGAGVAIAVIVGCVVITLSLIHANTAPNKTLAAIFWLNGMALLFAFIIPALIAIEVTREHEQGTMDMLRTTLLRPADIVGAQLLNVFVALRIYFGLACCVLAPLIIATLAQGLLPGVVLLTGMISALLVLLTAALASQCAALLSRKTSVALTLSYLAAATIFFTPDFADNLFVKARETLEAVNFLDPFGALDETPGLSDQDRPVLFWSLADRAGAHDDKPADSFPAVDRWFRYWAFHSLYLLALNSVLLLIAITLFTRRHWRDP